MRKTTALALLFFAAGHCGTAASQNLVANPDFDSDMSSWSVNASQATLDTTHNIVGAAGSGSASITNTVGNNFGVGIQQCIVGPFSNVLHTFGGWIYVPAGQSGTSISRVAIGFYSDNACNSSIAGSLVTTSASAANDTWNLFTSNVVPMPIAGSVVISLQVFSTNAPFVAYFDGARFGVAPTTPVELQSFEVD